MKITTWSWGDDTAILPVLRTKWGQISLGYANGKWATTTLDYACTRLGAEPITDDDGGAYGFRIGRVEILMFECDFKWSELTGEEG